MNEVYDVLVIGGGVNGCGIARDAAGRGLTVALAEKGDLASGTSCASTKLFHGGLRYLEYGEFRLVRHALAEREVLLGMMPHIARARRFILPLDPEMRFDNSTPAGRLIALMMPWAKGRRPTWMIRLGLWLYDHLGGRKLLDATRRIDLKSSPEGAVLQDKYHSAFEYSDVCVEDSRLVVLNARDAAARGARVWTRCEVTQARREGDLWQVTLRDATGERQVAARQLVNAAGPWVEVTGARIEGAKRQQIRLVRGSHIVVPQLFDHEKCYFFQGIDGRIIFAIPYQGAFTLIGTTDIDHAAPDQLPQASEAEIGYLCAFASRYFKAEVMPDQVIWTYSGIRPLIDEGGSASAVSRDYKLSHEGSPALLTVHGGKITTYRRLAEDAVDLLVPGSQPWTRGAALPGGEFEIGGDAGLATALRHEYPFLTESWATRLIQSYGTEAAKLLGEAKSASDLGRSFGGTLTEREVAWLRGEEFATLADDILWRRGKIGLAMSGAERADLAAWLAATLPLTKD